MRWDQYVDIKQLRKDRKANAPQRLPRTRPRALTIPEPARPAQKWNPFRRPVPQQTLEQLQSPLFARLPPEVRHIIWTEALGGHMLHIVRAVKRLLAIECAESVNPDLETIRHGCWGLTNQMGDPAGFYYDQRTNHPARPANLLPLVQTCRRVYRETIFLLYENNIFDINHVDTPAYLWRSVLPQRLSQIRRVKFTYNYKSWVPDVSPFDLATWSEACNALSRLAGLHELTVNFTEYPMLDRTRNRLVWESFLQPLMQIKQARRFKVFLPMSEDWCLQMAAEKEYPFKLLPRIEVPVKLNNDYNVEL